jgi:type II secretory ATPase GspE/PulE/Tfp pilus assembly ATPase PilB-like protein
VSLLTRTPLLDSLDEATRQKVLEAPRSERQGLLAEQLGEDEDDILTRLSEGSGLGMLEELDLLPEPTRILPLRLIHEYQCLPVVAPASGERAGGNGREPLHLVTVWPPEPVMDKWIHAACGRRPVWHLGLASSVSETITQVFGVGSGSLEGEDLDQLTEQEQQEEEDEDAAIIRFVNEVITKALTDRATDIHFEPQKESLTIRYRIDGQLVPIRVPDNLVQFQRAIISRIKIMARLNISERRRPQDGRIAFHQGGEDELDIRISTLPTMYGESVSLRLLNQKSQPLSIQELGVLPDDEKLIEGPISRPHGIILVTGPTGSGKSTTLSAFMRQIRSPERRIITIEDPVEYEITGVNQTQVHPEIGLTFANALRTVLRQDPDVIMVGEIRDRETAEIAVRASLTGHLVLSTLHTNDAPGAITRLIDMEIEPFLIASSVEMVIAQRLVRRLCSVCGRHARYDEKFLRSCLVALRIPLEKVQQGETFKEPVGCDACRGLGFRGRVGIFEILRVNEEIHELIVHKASAREIRQAGNRHGMRTLQQSGWEQCRRGLTSLPEVMRFAEGVESEEDEEA